MAVWTIAGEAGKAWNATAQTLAYRSIDGGQLDFRSLDADTLTLAIVPEDFTTYTMPELGQVIKLYRNGTLFFTGHVTDAPFSVQGTAQTVSVVVSGAWWWLERINYVTTQTDGTGATASRMTGVFGDATSGTNLKTAIETAIDRCVVLGAPIANIAGGSTVATYFQVPRVTLNQGTCAFVLTELIRLVPDTMVYFDYSTSTPTLQVTRRGVATTRTLTIGTDPIESMDVRPIYEMKVDQVLLPYVERDILGRTQFNSQSSGSATTGKIQVVTMSGPELDTFLPNDLFEKTTIRTASSIGQFGVLGDRQFDAARELGLTTIGVSLSNYNWTYAGQIAQLPAQDSTYVVAASSLSNAEGDPISTTGLYYTLGDNLPDWAIEEYGLIPVTLAGIFYDTWISERNFYNINGSYISTTTYNTPAWYPAVTLALTKTGYRNTRTAADTAHLYTGTINATGYLSATSYHWAGTVRAGSGATTIVLATTASTTDDFYVGLTVTWRVTGGARFTDTITDYVGSTRAATLSQTWSAAQRPATGQTYELQGHPLYRPADYTFIAPPANLAANLLAAQNFTPYEGTVVIVQETSGATRYRGCKVNIAGSISAHSSMAALVSGETLDLKSGITTITLGTPPRVDYRTFVDRIRKTPQDNIVFNV